MELQPLRRFFGSSVCRSCRSKLLHNPRRPFATSSILRADDDPTRIPTSASANPQASPRQTPPARSLFQNAEDAFAPHQQQSTSRGNGSALDELRALSTPDGEPSKRGSVDDFLRPSTSFTYTNLPSLTGNASNHEPFVLHVTTHKHNTHLALTGPFPPASALRGPHDRRRSICMSSGRIGFRKAGRGSYDAGFQLASFVFSAINERDILPLIQERGLEVRYRGFGKGREAVTKALLGQEGRWIRGKVLRVSDVTALKFGGVRSKKPRRLG